MTPQSRGVTLIPSKASCTTSHPSPLAVPGPLPVKNVAAVAFPLNTHLAQFDPATPNLPPFTSKYVPMCPTAKLAFHLGVVLGRRV